MGSDWKIGRDPGQFRLDLKAGAGILRIPGCIRQEFLEESVRKNNLSMKVICGIIFGSEIFNIARVIFWSKSGLASQNNRIYFSMYWILILIAASWPVLRRFLRRDSAYRQWIAQYAVTCLILLWNIGLNTYDLHRDPGAGTTVLTTALFGLALLIQMPPLYGLAQFGGGYLLFRVVMAPLLDTGDRLNLTITFVVALMVTMTHAHHTAMMLKQQKQIAGINAKLQEMVQLDLLTGLLNKTTVECRAEQMLQNAERRGKTGGLTLFLIDLDAFKGINDRYGHPCGDYVLTEMAESMRCAFPDASALGRIGGDEFAVLYDCPLTEKQAVDLVRSLEDDLDRIQWENQPLGIRCSAGACICSQPQATYQQVYTEADRMLYQAKATGKGRCCVGQLDHPLEEAEAG